MRHPSVYLLLTVMSFALWACQPEEKQQDAIIVPEALPLKEISLLDLSAFDPLGENWQLAAHVRSDFLLEHDLQIESGTGILVCIPSENERSNLLMGFEHGDMELEIEFLMPKGSNSGLYFQGRYEIQLFDSWNVKDATSGDCGGIYERWDDALPDGKKGFDGVPPRVNASKAPGLWQSIKVVFRAPRFDSDGNKTANARFEQVFLNGKRIHENVELSGPTRASADDIESPQGKFMIQGDHGPVAFRNIRYKTYDHTQKLTLNDISYNYYEGEWDTLPDFGILTPIDSGVSNWLDVRRLAKRDEGYGFVFSGTLTAPVSGTYLFDVWFDNGGELFIDKKPIVGDVGKNGAGGGRNLVELSAGQHDFEVSHFQGVWGSTIYITYEGPHITKQTLGLEPPEFERTGPDPIIVEAKLAPEMLRGFIQYEDTVKTHALSVGDPSEIHYTYDLATGALILGWKGDFADVTGMWHSRGQSQLLDPGNAAITFNDGPVLGSLVGNDWRANSHYLFRKYMIDEDERPVFHATYDDITVTDKIVPSDSEVPGLTRTITIENGKSGDMALIASGNDMEVIANGWINVGGNYYLVPSASMGQNMQIIDEVGIVVPVSSGSNKIQYTVVW